MANVAQALKAEIVRVARQQIRAEIGSLRKSSSRYRSEIAALKRELAGLKQQLSRGQRIQRAPSNDTPPTEVKVRFSATRLKQHRARLGLSAHQFSKLFGVSEQTIYNWEAGTRPRKEFLVMIAQLRNLTTAQAKTIVAERSQ